MSWKRTALVVVVVGLVACRSPDPDVPEETPDTGDVGVIDVMVEDYSFLAPPTMRSGWTTFRMTNEGEEPHFMLLYRLPEGTTFDDYTAQLSQPFQAQYDSTPPGRWTVASSWSNSEASFPNGSARSKG